MIKKMEKGSVIVVDLAIVSGVHLRSKS